MGSAQAVVMVSGAPSAKTNIRSVCNNGEYGTHSENREEKEEKRRGGERGNENKKISYQDAIRLLDSYFQILI